ncbi:MAG: riboflavin synthase [Acidobacteriota bacterium]|nr:riboflavin synthase [Acidobacteriota bacterium]
MFTGLIESTGTLLATTPTAGATRITILAPVLAPRLREGDSIAVNGVCLTALDIRPDNFSADLAAETMERTTLAELYPGSTVNLELPTPAGSPLGGHVVQGHVDGTATLVSLIPITPGADETDWRLRLALPEELLRYVVSQGSITVDGISLTVAALHENIVEIAIIPHTYAVTHLATLQPGARVNIETDVLARYAAQQYRKPATFELTEAYLLANGY